MQVKTNLKAGQSVFPITVAVDTISIAATATSVGSLSGQDPQHQPRKGIG